MEASYTSFEWLGRHREYFSSKVCEATGADEVIWLDFPSGEKSVDKNEHVHWDREWRQLDFLSSEHPALMNWKAAWPTDRQAHNWDAVGRLQFGVKWEWLLVEEKANIEEIESECKAEDPDSVALIDKTLDATKTALCGAPAADWMRPYYQFCNRLALLNVLHDSGACARLLFVYFYGDVQKRRHCPADKEGWRHALEKQDAHVGLADNHKLNDRIHECFVHVECPT